MKRSLIRLSVSVSLFLSWTTSLCAVGPVIFQGRVSDTSGKAVAGAEIRLLDSSGKLRHRVLSDIKGQYRFPPVVDIPGTPVYQIKISHLRFKPVQIENALDGPRVPASRANLLDPIALVAMTETVSHNLVLTPSRGTPQHPAAGPVDPNLAEYYYQRGLLHLGRNERSQAVSYLTLYAQLGQNPRQVARALELIAQNQ